MTKHPWLLVLAGSVAAIALANSVLPWGEKRALPCGLGQIRPASPLYCALGRHMVTEELASVLEQATQRLRSDYPGTTVHYLDASGRFSRRLWPHRSHGDGNQLDLALFYETLDGRPMSRPPAHIGYGAYAPPRSGERRACEGSRPADFGDPPDSRNWRLDEGRTRALIQVLIDDPRVRRIFLEPHLINRLGFSGHPKVRFAGCQAARHDDHIHIDLH